MQQKLFIRNSGITDIPPSQNGKKSLPLRYQHQLAQVLDVAVAVLDLDFCIIHWNHQAETLYGWKSEEVLGLPLGQILPADYRNTHEALCLDLLQTAGKWEGEVVHKTRQGEKRYVHTSFHLSSSSPREILMVSRNISDTKEMRDSMLAINQHLQFHIDNSPLAYIQWNEQFRVQHWSDRATAIFGWAAEEVRGKTWQDWQFVYQEDQKKVDKLMLEILEGNDDNAVCSGRFYTKTDKVVHCEWYNSVVRDEKGRITSMLSLISDVTEKVATKEKLDEVHQQLEHTLSSIRNVVWSLEVVGGHPRVKYISPNVDQITGVSSFSLSRNIRQWLQLIHPKDLSSYKRHLIMFMGGRSDQTELEYRIIDRYGRVKWVLDQVSVERKEDRMILYGSLKDITSKRELRKLVEENERKIRHITETIPGVIFQFIRTSDGREWFEYVNKERRGTPEMKEGVLQSNTFKFWEKVVLEDRPALEEAIRQSEEQLARFDFSFRAERGGAIIWNRAVAEPVWSEEEKRTIWTGIIMDVTEQRQLLEQLETRNFELTNFAYRVSHDLRAPLSSVKGLVGLVQMEEISPTIASYISMIESSIHRLDQFISNVLHHTKVANDALKTETIDFRQTTAEILDELSHMPAYDRIEKQIEISEEIENYGSDPMLIMVILRNLISNGIKYHDPHKPHSYFRVSITTAGPGIRILYEDNGIGIAEDKLSKVFDMFYRASESASGSGIGLYILKQAVEKLQGHIQIQSTLQQGTSFEVTLPELAK